MKKLFILPGLLLLSALIPCGETKCDDKSESAKQEKMQPKKGGMRHKWLKFRGTKLDVTNDVLSGAQCVYREVPDRKNPTQKKMKIDCTFEAIAAMPPVYTTGTPERQTPAEKYGADYIGSSMIKGKGIGGDQRIDYVCQQPCKDSKADKEKKALARQQRWTHKSMTKSTGNQ